MAFICRCDPAEGFCKCGKTLFYYPKDSDEIGMYDWVLVGKNWGKIRFTEYNWDHLVKAKCLFAKDVHGD